MFFAALHIHSKFSRATGKDADLEHMALWARKKGVSVVSTGDFTHPQWMKDLREKLVPAEPGLFRLRDDLERDVQRQLNESGFSDSLPATSTQSDSAAIACQAGKPDLLLQGITRFLLEVEISTIYKKGDFTRKVHHCVYAPDFDAVDRMIARLARIGNLASDCRPILGLFEKRKSKMPAPSGRKSQTPNRNSPPSRRSPFRLRTLILQSVARLVRICSSRRGTAWKLIVPSVASTDCERRSTWLPLASGT